MNEHVDVQAALRRIREQVGREIASRAVRASFELRNAALAVLRGGRSGRLYRVPGTGVYYRASAPGEPPAVRTDVFRKSWRPRPEFRGTSGKAAIVTDYPDPIPQWLEEGTPGGQMAPRPYVDRIKERAWPRILFIFRDRYLGGL